MKMLDTHAHSVLLVFDVMDWLHTIDTHWPGMLMWALLTISALLWGQKSVFKNICICVDIALNYRPQYQLFSVRVCSSKTILTQCQTFKCRTSLCEGRVWICFCQSAEAVHISKSRHSVAFVLDSSWSQSDSYSYPVFFVFSCVDCVRSYRTELQRQMSRDPYWIACTQTGAHHFW